MAPRVQLKAEKRELLGKRVRQLRRKGLLPATIYGHGITSESIQVGSHDLQTVLRQAGTTQLIDLSIDSQPVRPVLVRQTTIDAKRNSILHVEFFQANLKERTTTHVHLHIVGESQAVKDGGIVLQVLDHVDIESLPQNVPAEGIEVDISSISEFNGAIHAGELHLPPDSTLITPADEMVVKVNAPVSEAALAESLAEPESEAAEPADETAASEDDSEA